MEDNINVTLQKEDLGQPSVPVKKCRHCGKVLPLEHFATYGKGHRSICENCRRDMSGVSEKFAAFTSRELIDELKSRGYRGELTRVITEVTKL